MPVPGQKISAGQLIRKPNEDEEKVAALRLLEQKIGDFFSGATKPLKRMGQIYREERLTGRALVESSYKDEGSIWDRAKRLLFGTSQYVFSPLTAFAQGIVREPIEEAGKEAGLPEEVAEFAGKLGEAAVYTVPIGGTIKSAMMRKYPGLKAGEKAAEALARMPKPKKTKIAEEVVGQRAAAREAIKSAEMPKMKASPKALAEAKVRENLVGNITVAAEDALKGNYDSSRRIFRQIGEHLQIGDIDVGAIPEILKKHNLSPAQFAKAYEEVVSSSGRILQQHSVLRKKLLKAFKDSPEAIAMLETKFAQDPVYAIDKALEAFGSLENFRRAMLVGQIATGMRNIWSQTGRITIGALDDSLQGIIRKTFSVEKHNLNEVAEGLNTVVATINRLNPRARKQLFNILEENHNVLSKVRLFSQPVHEVALTGKFATLVNSLNRAQEFFFRRIAFEAKLRSLLNRKGLKFSSIDPKFVPKDIVEEAANYALEMTFAASPKSKSVQNIVRWWTKFPGLTTINPFPRFHFGNALPFIYEHSPLGYLQAVGPKAIKELASGDPTRFAKYASRATIGSLMLDSAMRIRQSKYAGEKWYEIKVGEDEKTGKSKVMDVRAYAPLSTHLFLAEALTNPGKLEAKDWWQLGIGLNRVAGTGLVALDWIRARTGEGLRKQVMNFAGQYTASFGTPFRTLSDFYAGIDPEEAFYRDYRESPFIAPFLLNFPKISQRVPAKYSPTKRGRIVKGEPIADIPSGIFRQVTGVSFRTKTAIEREVDRVGLDWTRVIPRTGVPHADREISKRMGYLVEKVGPLLVRDNANYAKLSEPAKRIALAEMFKWAREQARRDLAVDNPKLALEISIEGMSGDLRKLLEGGIKPGTRVR